MGEALIGQVLQALQSYSFCWYGQRGLDAFSVAPELPTETIACCDYGIDTAELEDSLSTAVISVEKSSKFRDNWSNFSLDQILRGSRRGQFVRALRRSKKPTAIVAYCSTSIVEQVIGDLADVRLLAPPARLKAELDDKRLLRRVLPTLGLAAIPCVTVNLGTTSYAEMARMFGELVVVQRPVGASGSGTAFVQEERDFVALQHKWGTAEVLVSKMVKGRSLNINALVGPDYVAMSRPSIQLVGFDECTRHRETYCGNDFASAELLGDDLTLTIYAQVRSIGTWMRRLGFMGMFGIDFVVAEDTGVVYPIEVNPRWQGSTQILTEGELRHSALPLAVASIAMWLDVCSPLLQEWANEMPPRVGTSQLILYSRETGTSVVTGSVEPGIYHFEADQLTFVRSAVSLSACTVAEDILITCAVPRVGTVVRQGAPLLKVQSCQPMVDVNTGNLLAWPKVSAHVIYNRLGLVPSSP